MISSRTLRALPTLFRVGFAEAIAYRAEMFVWVLSTTMPLVMLALWSAVARDAPVQGLGQTEITAYFLATFIVRQLTGAWAAWQMNFEVRTGTMAMRLLRPIHPLWGYVAENLAAMPLRLVIAVPLFIFLLFTVGTGQLAQHPLEWVMFFVALAGAWAITFLANVAIGTLALYMESSLKVMDVWIAGFFVFSGYMIPIAFFPPAMQAAVEWLPFRYQIGLPVELMTGRHDLTTAFGLLMRQWVWILALGGLCSLLWRRGMKRFAAYGG